MEPHPKNLNIENIRAIKVLGKGAMGTVFLAHDSDSDPDATTPFALKVVEKSLLYHKHNDAQRRARWEMSVLATMKNHPFLPTLLGSFETHELMGWAVPFCCGGDLNVLRYTQNDRVFSSAAIKFYLAQIVCALAHLHSMGIAYRDLKPENVLVQSSGHVTLTDFDLSRKLSSFRKKKPVSLGSSEMDMAFFKECKPPPPPPPPRRNNLTRILTYGANIDTGLRKPKSARVSPRRASFAAGKRSNSFVGTEEYVSPEVVRGEGHEFGVDWWALGILAYEMLYGRTPFRGKNRKETFRNVLMIKPEFIGKRTSLTDLIERLLEKDPNKRLGHFRGAEEIKEHEFFKGLRWDLLTEVERPPIVPATVDVDLTNVVTFDVREYFPKSRLPPSLPPSPGRTLSSLSEERVSLTEF
ncbi:serine/threonine-protein kinase UCNL [Spinacia oleracea]|uniref:non-specific serine/threonine protein kinase n=1 Tax=Spinacia oleracea TaxID=3562 RepID=A0A9R0KA43_SPIOL|nr:serine/threonine-protein kinase UCNL [Spinacia oleracea]